MSDAAFLAGIAAHPADRTRRLVYADYLDEQGDPRGELVRVEEEMQHLPAFSDRFWELKPRRNELRSQVPADWLAAMRYGVDVHPGVRPRLAGRREVAVAAHPRVRGAVARGADAGRGRLGGGGGRGRGAAGADAGVRVREFAALAADHRVGSGHRHFFRDGTCLRDLPGHDALTLILQSEGDYHWAVRHADLPADDPPVSGFHWDFDADDEDGAEDVFVPDRANPLHDRLTDFLLSHAVGYTRGHSSFGTDVADVPGLRAGLDAAFRPPVRLGPGDCYESPNLLVFLNQRRLNVVATGPITVDQVPRCLLALTGRGGSFSGFFVPDTGRPLARPRPARRRAGPNDASP